MLYTTLAGENVSRLGMGAMRLPVNAKYVGHIDEEAAQQINDYALAHGINYFDTAYIYHKGASESFLGKALSGYPRDAYFLATKFFIAADPKLKTVFKHHLDRLGINVDADASYERVFETQLEKLQTDYIDFYLMHSVLDFTSTLYKPAVKYFLKQKELGRIRHLGFSSHMGPRGLKKFIDVADWDFVQLQINYEDWLFGKAQQLYDIATQAKLPIVVMEPVKGGNLATLGARADSKLKEREPNRSIASWAFRWLMTKPNIKVILSGMTTLDQMIDNVDTFSEDCALTPDDAALLENMCRQTHSSKTLPCTSCRYCCDSCPKGIDIPAMMRVYNILVTEGRNAAHREMKLLAQSAASSHSGPESCIACGACQSHCPQGITIPATMKKLANLGDNQ